MTPLRKSDIGKKLFSEHSVFDVLRTFESAYPPPLTAKWLSFLSIMIALVFSVAYYSSEPILEDLHKVSESLVDFSGLLVGALFGVVIAGFSIFASSLQPAILLRLIETDYPGTQANNLTFIFSMFIYVLATLFTVFAAIFFYKLTIGPNSAILGIPTKISPSNHASSAILLIFISLLIGQLVFVFSILFSFIWNLHQILLVIAGKQAIDAIDQKKPR